MLDERAISPRLDRRSLWLARPGRSRLHGILALSSEFALRGEQGGERSSGPRLCRDLWHAGADHQLLQQLRRLSAPGKTHSADDHPCAGRQAAADLWRRLQCPRLAARVRSLRGVDERDRARPHRRNLQCRRRQRAQQPRRGGPDLRHDRCRLRSRRPPRRALSVLSRSRGRLLPHAHYLCDGPPRPRSPLCDRRQQARDRTRQPLQCRFRARTAADRAVVSRPRSHGGATSPAAPTRRGSTRITVSGARSSHSCASSCSMRTTRAS